MLERAMQYQKAQLKVGEASNMLTICRDLDNIQQDKMNSIVPTVVNHWNVNDFV